MSRIQNLNNRKSLNNESKLAALFSIIQDSFTQKIRIKEGSTFLNLYKKYKKHFNFLINNKPLKKKLIFDETFKIKSSDIFYIDNTVTYEFYKKRPFLLIDNINTNEEDVCFFCLNTFDDLKKHLKEEIKDL